MDSQLSSRKSTSSNPALHSCCRQDTYALIVSVSSSSFIPSRLSAYRVWCLALDAATATLCETARVISESDEEACEAASVALASSRAMYELSHLDASVNSVG